MDASFWLIVAELTLCDWKWPLPPLNTSWNLKIFCDILQWVTEKKPNNVDSDRIAGSARQLVSVPPPACICVCVYLGSLTERFHGDNFILAQALAGLVDSEPSSVEEVALDTHPETQQRKPQAWTLNRATFIFTNPNIQGLGISN